VLVGAKEEGKEIDGSDVVPAGSGNSFSKSARCLRERGGGRERQRKGER